MGCDRSRGHETVQAVPHSQGVGSQHGQVVERIRSAALALVLHEAAEQSITHLTLPGEGDVLLIVGPEGGISPEELSWFQEAGAVPIRISDGVLRTSTAGAVALGQLSVLAANQQGPRVDPRL